MGEVIQLQGDQRKDVQEFLVAKDGLELDAKTIKVRNKPLLTCMILRLTDILGPWLLNASAGILCHPARSSRTDGSCRRTRTFFDRLLLTYSSLVAPAAVSLRWQNQDGNRLFAFHDTHDRDLDQLRTTGMGIRTGSGLNKKT